MNWDAIILNWNQAAATIRCVNSLLAWTHTASKLWVVDNASSDGSREMIPRLCPTVSYLYNDVNLGFAGGNNVALRKIASSESEAVLLLNGDAGIAEDQALRLLAALRDNPRLGVVGPLLEERQGNRRIVLAGGRDMARYPHTRIIKSPGISTGRDGQPVRPLSGRVAGQGCPALPVKHPAALVLHSLGDAGSRGASLRNPAKPRTPFLPVASHRASWRRRVNTTDFDSLMPVDYVPGTAAMVRTDLLRTIGLLDEAYFFSGEMADFCRRARLAGWTCAICPQSVATHAPEAGATRATLYRYYTLRNRFLFVRKHEPARRRRLFAFWLGCGVLMTAFAFVRGHPAQARAACLAMRDGLAGRFGNRNELFGG